MVMSKSMNVTFDDGTSHTFDEVPDDVTQEQVIAKAAEMFPDRKIMDTNEGAHPEAPPLPTAEQQTAQQPSLGTQALGAAQTIGGAAMAHPGLAAGAAGLWKANQLANTWQQGAKANQALAEAQMAREQGIQGRFDVKQAAKMPPSPVQPSYAQSGAYSPQPNMAPQNVTPQMQPRAPIAPPAQPAVGGPAAEQGTSFLENIAQKYANISKQFAPALQGMAESPLGRVASGAMRIAGSAPVMGAQLMAHSGGLNTNEDQLLADKHRLEAQMLMNKHAAEWNKYKSAQQATQGQ